jgi:hypothetical protein
MTGDTGALGRGDQSPEPNKEELKRLLIEQFYEDSVERYGIDSGQARALWRFLISC